MADSGRQRIVDAIVARMALINGTGSYETNIGGRSKDSRTNWHAGDGETASELPAISVFDGDSEPFPTTAGDYKAAVHVMSVLIKGFVTQGTTAANARKLLKDIKTAIRQDDKWTVSNVKLAMQTRERPERITRNAESFEVDGCELEIEVHFITNKFNAELRS